MTSAVAAAKKKKGIPPRKTGLLSSPRRYKLFLAVLLVAATLALYWPVQQHPFANYDDDEYITVNPHVKSGLTRANLEWAFTSYDVGNWHPLTWLSHDLDCQLFQLNPTRHHQVNLFVHLLNVLLLFWVLRKATGYVGRTAMVAALFALHPINVESVAWIAERKNLLSMTFFLLALGAYRWYVEWAPQPFVPARRDQRKPSLGRPEAGQIGRYSVVVVLFALGLMAKPQVITLPFVLLLWDYWPLQRMFASSSASGTDAGIPARSFSWLILEKLPLVALSAASAVITMKAQQFGGGINPDIPFSLRLGNAIVSYARYLIKAVWPSHFALVYPHPGNSLRAWQVVLSLALLLAISALVFAVRHQRRYLVVGWLWFLGTLVPMIGLVQVGVQGMADRYAYLPFVGLFIMIGWGAGDLLAAKETSTPSKAGESAEPRRVVLACTCVATLAALMLVAHRQIGYWNDNVTLWEHTLQVTSRNWVAENNLAHALLSSGQEDDAIVHFRSAVAINPSDADSTLNLGAYEHAHKHLFTAIELYKRVITMTQNTARLNAPKRSQTFRNMGHAYRQLGDFSDARASFRQAVELNPNDGESWLGLGIMAHKLGDLSTAIPAYSQALKVESLDWVYVLQARALEQSGRNDEARAAMLKASQVSKNLAETERTAEKVLTQ